MLSNNANIVVVQRETLASQEAPNKYLVDLHFERIDGVVVKNFLSTQELVSIRSGVSTLNGSEFLGMQGGATFPRIFATADQFKTTNGILDYFEYAADVRERYVTEYFSLSLEARLTHTFHLLSGLQVRVPQGARNQHSYLPFSVRILYPGQGGLPLHTDDKFLSVSEICSKHLSSISRFETHSSFIMLVSKPKGGGNLVFPERKLHGGFDPSDMEEGDLFVFLSQKIPHTVTDILGCKNRITIGGFTGLSIDSEALYFWS